MTISTLTLSEAAALVPMAADRLAHWAELGYVPGAVHGAKHKHWKFNRDVFLAGLIPLQVMLADVERRGIVDGSKRNPATGLPFVVEDVGALVTVTDRVTVTPVLTICEAIAQGEPIHPWWATPWLIPLAVVVGSLAAYFWRF